MKYLCYSIRCLAAMTLCMIMPSCGSDTNPLDYIKGSSGTTSTAFIKLNMDVADTRAGILSTDDEKLVRKVNIYIFDESDRLETAVRNKEVSAGENSVTLEVSHGLKTIYVITSQAGVNPAVGTSIIDFENLTFASTPDKLKTTDGFMMIGKSAQQQVMMSSSQDDMPQSNVFAIELVRQVAKAQVKCAAVDGSAFGIKMESPAFRVCQTSDKMYVVHSGTDIISNYVDSNNNGTYDGYSLGDTSSYVASAAGDFTADGCVYMAENIVARPRSGNTTFLSVRFVTTPLKYYSFADGADSPTMLSDTPVKGATYYTVGIIDRTNGISDYAVDHATKNVLTFKNQADAERYMTSLNAGEAASVTVSQTDGPMSAPAVRADDSHAAQFEVLPFVSGYAYYRVNIAHEEKSGDKTVFRNKVMRNKYYKVNISSVSNLGFSSEALLRPANPDAAPDAEGSSWISASISVAEWDEIRQNVDL